MSFPRVPYKPITGQLKLSIRSPEIETVVGEEPTVDNGPDISDNLSFKLPKGFSISSDPRKVVSEQRLRVLGQLSELSAKRERCAACKKATSQRMIDITEEAVLLVCQEAAASATTIKIRFYQEKDGTLVTLFETPSKTLGLKVMTSAIEVGYFLPNGLSSEKKHRIADFQPGEHSNWLINN